LGIASLLVLGILTLLANKMTKKLGNYIELCTNFQYYILILE
jgi:hypothetical protein